MCCPFVGEISCFDATPFEYDVPFGNDDDDVTEFLDEGINRKNVKPIMCPTNHTDLKQKLDTIKIKIKKRFFNQLVGGGGGELLLNWIECYGEGGFLPFILLNQIKL